MSVPTYTTNDWRGHPHYECDQCPFDSLDKTEIVVHVQAIHTPPLPTTPIAPTTTEVVAVALHEETP